MTPQQKTLQVPPWVTWSTHGPVSQYMPCLEMNPGDTEDTRNPDNQTLTQELKTKFQGLKFSGQQWLHILGNKLLTRCMKRKDSCAKTSKGTKLGFWTQSLSQARPPCGVQFPTPIPPKPTEEQDCICPCGGLGLDSAAKTVCLQQITSRKVIPLGSTWKCNSNMITVWKTSFSAPANVLSICLNLKERSVLECLENITPFRGKQTQNILVLRLALAAVGCRKRTCSNEGRSCWKPRCLWATIGISSSELLGAALCLAPFTHSIMIPDIEQGFQ